MLLRARPQERWQMPASQIELVSLPKRAEPASEQSDKAELRRQMYERIARGNALSESEEDAQRRWK